MSMRKVSAMTEDELKALIRDAVREEFSAAGLRIDDADNRDEAKEDFRFLRRLRQRTDSVANKIGMAIITVILLGAAGMLWDGFRNSIK